MEDKIKDKMGDKIENFITDHREAFDVHEPRLQLWSQIESQLRKKEEKKIIFFWTSRIAASLIFVLVCGVLLGIMIADRRGNDLDYSSHPELAKFKEAENYYEHQVSLKLNQLDDQNTKTTVEEDIKQLDEIYNELKKEMIESNYSNTDMLINAMIKNHKTKVDILENILEKQNLNKNGQKSISI